MIALSLLGWLGGRRAYGILVAERSGRWKQAARLLPDSAVPLLVLAQQRLAQAGPRAALPLLRRAAMREPLVPSIRLRLAAVELQAGRRRAAAREARRAVRIDPTNSDVGYEAALLLLQVGEVETACRFLRAVLVNHPARAPEVFDALWPLSDDPRFILERVLPPTAAMRRRLLHYAIGRRLTDAARAAWAALAQDAQPADRLAYVEYLIGQGAVHEAAKVWEAAYGPPPVTLVRNSGFERPLAGGGFGWWVRSPRGARVGVVRTVRAPEGKHVLRVVFGGGNVEFSHVRQYVEVPEPGEYELRAWVRADGITSLDGPRLEITGAGCRLRAVGPQWLESFSWRQVRIPLQVPPDCQGVVVMLVRPLSHRFDKLISGTLELDAVALARRRSGGEALQR